VIGWERGCTPLPRGGGGRASLARSIARRVVIAFCVCVCGEVWEREREREREREVINDPLFPPLRRPRPRPRRRRQALVLPVMTRHPGCIIRSHPFSSPVPPLPPSPPLLRSRPTLTCPRVTGYVTACSTPHTHTHTHKHMRTRTAASGDVGCFFYFFCFFLCFFFAGDSAGWGWAWGGTRTPPLSLPHPHPQAVSAAGGFIARGGKGRGCGWEGPGQTNSTTRPEGLGTEPAYVMYVPGGGNCVSCTHTYIRTYIHTLLFFFFSSSDGRTDYGEISWWLHLTYPALAPLAEFPS